MSKEQIEEMANDIDKSHWKITQDFMGCHINSEEMAEHLYNAGYRKQSEVAREIFAEIEKHDCKPLPEVEEVYVLTKGQLAELKRKYTGGEG